MARLLLHHRHEAEECGESQALGLLPSFVAERATAIKVSEVHIP